MPGKCLLDGPAAASKFHTHFCIIQIIVRFGQHQGSRVFEKYGIGSAALVLIKQAERAVQGKPG